jgi:hypothetical protein
VKFCKTVGAGKLIENSGLKICKSIDTKNHEKIAKIAKKSQKNSDFSPFFT